MATKPTAKSLPKPTQRSSAKTDASHNTIDIFSGKTAVEEAVELDRLALEAERGTEKSRPTTMAESVQHEVEAAIRWVSEVSTDSRRALVLATNPKGEMVVTMMRASGPSAAANYSYSFTLSKMEVRTIKQFLGLEIGEEVANVSTG